MPLAETLNLRLGYNFDRDVATVAAWSAATHHGTAGLGVTLPHALLLDVMCEITGKKYDEILLPATETRSDTTVAAGASLTWQAAEQYSVSLGYYYTDNHSNIPGYEYHRGISSIMLQGRY